MRRLPIVFAKRYNLAGHSHAPVLLNVNMPQSGEHMQSPANARAKMVCVCVRVCVRPPPAFSIRGVLEEFLPRNFAPIPLTSLVCVCACVHVPETMVAEMSEFPRFLIALIMALSPLRTLSLQHLRERVIRV